MHRWPAHASRRAGADASSSRSPTPASASAGGPGAPVPGLHAGRQRAARRKAEGTGLGLHLSHKLAELLGGAHRRRAASPAAAAASPCCSRRRGPDHGARPGHRGQRRQPRADDLPAARLGSRGADGGRRRDRPAVARAERPGPDRLRHPDARHRRLRGGPRAARPTRRCAGVPLVAVTACAMVGDREKALAAGFDAHVAKPIDADGASWQRVARCCPAT